MIAKSHRWNQVAVAVVTLCGLWGSGAMALSLGRITVQSALGEPLRAEVELLDINADEAASLKPAVASPESFRAAGLDYNPALATLQASLQRRPDGRAYIRLNGERAINDPFVDLILETRWSSGRIVRDYTLLIDPPNLRVGSAAAPLPAQVNVQTTSRSTNAVTPAAAPTPATAVSGSRPPTQAAKAAALAVPRALVPTTPAAAATRVSVKPGDTASKIAAATRPENVSLDQMLIALLRTNPASFMADNVNRIKAGAILNIPTADQAASTPAAEAAQLIVAQSRDFNEFRRKLAQSAPDTPLIAADRLASGTIEARVEEKKPSATAPDKLTLSKGVIEKVSAEDRLAKERSAKDAVDRAAELAKNISDLGKLGSATGAATSAASGTPSPTVTAVAPTQPLDTGAKALPNPAASGVKVTPPVATKPAAGMLDSVFEDPLLPLGAASVFGLLALLGFYRYRQRSNRSQADGAPIENRVRPDAYFAASGGQNVDTNHGAETGSSLVSAPSQIESVGIDDVDPVAEADVYLAYGRDLQAEEILKDALRAAPERIAIHQKLLELFAKRRDAKSFQHIAAKAFRLTDSDSLEWQRIRELGLSIDPGNPRYLPGWQPAEAEGKPSMPAPLEETSTRPGGLSQTTAAVDLDLDLDFSVDEEPEEPIGETSASVAETAPSGLSATPVISAPAAPAKPEAPEFDMLKFDLGSLSLDLGEEAAPEPSSEPVKADDPLATKLALSEEFVAIGDVEGARALIEEVIAEATGDIKLKAKMALNDLQSL